MEANGNLPSDVVGQDHDVASANFSAPVFPASDCPPTSEFPSADNVVNYPLSMSSVSSESISCDLPLIVPVHMPPPSIVMNVPPPGFLSCDAENATQVPAQFILPFNAFVQQPDPCLPFMPFYQISHPDPSALPAQNVTDIAMWKQLADRFIYDNMEQTTTKVLNLTSTKSHKPHKRRRSREKKKRSRSRSRSRLSRSTSRSKRYRSRSRSRERTRRSRSHSPSRRTAERKRRSRENCSKTYERKGVSRSAEKIREVPSLSTNTSQSPNRTFKSAKSSEKMKSRKRSRSSSTDSTSSSSSSTSTSSDSTVDLTVKAKSSRALRTSKKQSARVSTKIRLKLGMKNSPVRPVTSPKSGKLRADSDSDLSSSPKSKRTKKPEASTVMTEKADEIGPMEHIHEKVQSNPGTSDSLLGTHTNGGEEDEVIVISHIRSSGGNTKPASPSPCEPAVQDVVSRGVIAIPFELGFEDRFGVAWSEDQFSDFFCADLILGRDDMQYPYWPPWCLGAICCPRYYYQIVA